MSKWTDFRDSVLDTLKVDEVTEKTKQELTAWLIETAQPLAEKAADSFVAQVKAQAESETGWCKLRDLIVLPFIVQGGLYLIKQTLAKTYEETA